jgi:ectoine hydroxylase-related dioxygenase (phytanoyl-CoA dioxygenase family)
MNRVIISAKALRKEPFVEQFRKEGYVVVKDVISKTFIDELTPQLQAAVKKEAEQYHSAGHKDYGMLLACPIYGGKFLELIENRDYIEPFNWILGETCIIWVYTSSCMPPSNGNYASRIHVDRPHFIPNFNEGVGSIVLLNDFTEENGATWFLPGSHLSPEEPGSDYFYKHAKRLIAPKGSVFYFNLRLWHAGGINHTDAWRNSIGIGMIRPYYKQRIDLPRALKDTDISTLSEFAKQKLGFYSQPPASLEEYYENARKRQEIQPSEWNSPVHVKG